MKYASWPKDALQAKHRDLSRDLDRAEYDTRNPNGYAKIQTLRGEMGAIEAELASRLAAA